MYSVQNNLSTIGQYIVLTGLGLEKFKQDLKAISNIYEFFQSETPGANFGDFKTLILHNLECVKIGN